MFSSSLFTQFQKMLWNLSCLVNNCVKFLKTSKQTDEWMILNGGAEMMKVFGLNLVENWAAGFAEFYPANCSWNVQDLTEERVPETTGCFLCLVSHYAQEMWTISQNLQFKWRRKPQKSWQPEWNGKSNNAFHRSSSAWANVPNHFGQVKCPFGTQ